MNAQPSERAMKAARYNWKQVEGEEPTDDDLGDLLCTAEEYDDMLAVAAPGYDALVKVAKRLWSAKHLGNYHAWTCSCHPCALMHDILLDAKAALAAAGEEVG